ncbi:MAG: amidohydrolase family protein [Hyphomonadaceae bacterium]
MSYAGDRLIHDADSHLMELPDCLDPYLDAATRRRFHESDELRRSLSIMLMADDANWTQNMRSRHADSAFRAGNAEMLMLRKNYDGLGAFIPQDRVEAISLLGFGSQLVFSTFCLGSFGFEDSGNVEMSYAVARAHNRMITDFCRADRRLLATGYVPALDFAQALETAREALDLGCTSLRVASRPTLGRSPSHIGLDPVWALAQEANVPILFHVDGYDAKCLNPGFHETGLPRVADFHGGDQNVNSVGFLALPTQVMSTLTALIFDGVMDRFPRLKFGVIEFGAAWMPGLMRGMDAALAAFVKNEERLQKLSATPSEIVRRQVRVTPFPQEDAGWLIANGGEEVFMFASDFPHVEGGRNPLKRFDDSLKNTPSQARERFFSGNFIDLMGAGLAPDLRTSRQHAAA